MEPAPKEISVPVLTLKSHKFVYKLSSSKSLIAGRDASTVDSSSPSAKGADPTRGAPGCFIVYPEGSSRLYFKVPDMKSWKKSGEVLYTMLECTDVSAADLCVKSKFGSWDTMTCRLLVECEKPLVAWTVTPTMVSAGKDPSSGGDSEGALPAQPVSSASNPQAAFALSYTATEQESCMVRATFDVRDVPAVRDVLHALKLAKVRERKELALARANGQDAGKRMPSLIREGLPEWVNYIPAHLYSRSMRTFFEYVLMIYTILTLTWAIWQLYRHVDFIRQYLRPIMEFIEHYLAILKNWMRWFDELADYLTGVWWTYMKPVYVLFVAAFAPLQQLFKPLRNISGLIGALIAPLVQAFRSLCLVLQPLVRPVLSAFDLVVWQGLRRVFGTLQSAFAGNQFMTVLSHRLRDLGIVRLFNELFTGSFDPLRAQVLLVQNLLIRSLRQLIKGLRFIVSRLTYMVVFVRRERRYAEEGDAAQPRGSVDSKMKAD